MHLGHNKNIFGVWLVHFAGDFGFPFPEWRVKNYPIDLSSRDGAMELRNYGVPS